MSTGPPSGSCSQPLEAGGGGAPRESTAATLTTMTLMENTMATMTLPKKGTNVNHPGLPVARHAGNSGVACPVAATAASGSKGGPTIFALDLGTVTGWALSQRDREITSGTVEFRNDRWQGGGMRFLRFKGWLTEIKQAAGGLDAVFLEEVRRHAGVDASHAYGGFLAVLTAWCEHHGVPYEAVPVGTIKRHVTGKGNADKAAVIAAVRGLGFHLADDNEADALALLRWAIDHRMAGLAVTVAPVAPLRRGER